jgi:putative tryptophan/tyrosine transport system substrate-binding protein
MKAKILVYALPALILATIHLVEAQQQVKIPRIGILQGGSAASSKNNLDAFRAGLHDLGYVQEKNIALEYRYADGKFDRLPVLASELVRIKVDLLLVGGTQTTTAAKQATSTIPIVVGGAGDLVAAGLVASLARPGGNVTGSTRMSKDSSGKRIELLKETVSKAARAAVLSFSATALLDRDELNEMESVARHLGVKVQSVDVSDPNEIQTVYKAMVKEHADSYHPPGLLQLISPTTTRRACGEKPDTINVRGIIIRERRLPHELWTGFAQPIPPRCDFRGQDSERRETRGFTRRAAHEV